MIKLRAEGDEGIEFWSFQPADSFTVDEQGNLFLWGDDKVVAVVNHDTWLSAQVVAPPKPQTIAVKIEADASQFNAEIEDAKQRLEDLNEMLLKKFPRAGFSSNL